MTEKIKKVIEDLTKDCTQEDKAKILQIVTPGEPGTKKKRVKMDYTSEEFERIKPILDGILAAINEEEREIKRALKMRYKEPSAEELAALESKYNKKAEQFKKQLEKARIFREKHFKWGMDLNKCRYLVELERAEEWKGVINAFNYGYMMGYHKAQEEARKKKKAAAAKEI